MAFGQNSGPPVGDIYYNQQQFSPCAPRRQPPFFSPEFRIFEINKRLQQHTEECDNIWWDAFVSEFFEDDASLTMSLCPKDPRKTYTIGRILIPRYFRNLFENGVTDVPINLKHSKESFHNNSVTLDCEQCTILTYHGKLNVNKLPPGTDIQVIREQQQINRDNAIMISTEGRLTLEFVCDDIMRIKKWHFTPRHHRELVPKGMLAYQTQQDPAAIEQLSKNATQQGLTNGAISYLKLCAILEPMQELMSRHKSLNTDLRDCLRAMLLQRWKQMVAPPENQKQTAKRRKRKSPASSPVAAGSGGGTSARGGKAKNSNAMSPVPPSFLLPSKDVVVVREPSLMSGDFVDEDERLIT